MRISEKYIPYVFILFMAASMGFVMSFTMTAANTGFTAGFIVRWFHSYVIGLIVAYPTALLVAPLGQRLISRINKEPGS